MTRKPGTLLAAVVVIAIALLAGDVAAQLETRARQRSPGLFGGGVAPPGVSYTAPGMPAGLASRAEAEVPLPAGVLKRLRVSFKLATPAQDLGSVQVRVQINGTETALICQALHEVVVGVTAPTERVPVNDGDFLAIVVANNLFSTAGGPTVPVSLPFSYSIEFE